MQQKEQAKAELRTKGRNKPQPSIARPKKQKEREAEGASTKKARQERLDELEKMAHHEEILAAKGKKLAQQFAQRKDKSKPEAPEKTKMEQVEELMMKRMKHVLRTEDQPQKMPEMPKPVVSARKRKVRHDISTRHLHLLLDHKP